MSPYHHHNPTINTKPSQTHHHFKSARALPQNHAQFPPAYLPITCKPNRATQFSSPRAYTHNPQSPASVNQNPKSTHHPPNHHNPVAKPSTCKQQPTPNPLSAAKRNQEEELETEERDRVWKEEAPTQKKRNKRRDRMR
jgi:hypothetical protein